MKVPIMQRAHHPLEMLQRGNLIVELKRYFFNYKNILCNKGFVTKYKRISIIYNENSFGVI